MKLNWENIKHEISSQEAPLSAHAWENLNAQLNAPKNGKKKLLWLLLALPLFFGVYFFILPTAEKEYHPRLPQNENVHFERDENEMQFKNRPDKWQRNSLVTAPPKASKNNLVEPILRAQQTEKSQNKHTTNTRSKTETSETAFVTKNNSTTPVEIIPQRDQQKNAAEIARVENNQTAETKVDPAYNAANQDTSNTKTQFAENETSNTNGPQKKWELKFYAGPNYTAGQMQYRQKENFTHKDLDQSVTDGTQPGWGFDAGIEASYFLTKHFKISTGFSYRKIVTQNNYNYQIKNIAVFDSASGQILGYLPTNNPQTVQNSTANQFAYLGIPVSLFYELPLKGKWSVTGEFVNTISFLLNQNSLLVNATTLEIDAPESNRFNTTLFSYQVRLGLRYQLSERWSMAFEPAYRGQYNNTFTTDDVVWKPHNFSLNLALILHLSTTKQK